MESPHDHFPSSNKGRGDVLGLLSIWLLEFRTIDIPEVNDLRSSTMGNGQLVSLVDREDSRCEVRPRMGWKDNRGQYHRDQDDVSLTRHTNMLPCHPDSTK